MPVPCRAALVSCLLALAGGGALRAQTERSYPEGLVAVVEGEPITRYDLELLCRLADQRYRLLGVNDPTRVQIMEQQLETLIEEKVLLLRARDEKVQLGPEDQARLARELEREAERYGGPQGLAQALQAEGVPLEFLQQRLQNNLIVTRLLLKHVSRDVFVTPEEVRRYYEEHLSSFTTKGLLRVRQIVVFPDGSCLRNPRPKLVETALLAGNFDGAAYAASLRERVIAGEPFEAVAQAGSMGPENGLVLDFRGTDRPQDTLNDPLPAVIEKLGVGELSPVTKSETGTLHLLLVEERSPPGPRPLATVQQEIELTLKDELWNRRVKDWTAEVKRQSVVLKFFPPRR